MTGGDPNRADLAHQVLDLQGQAVLDRAIIAHLEAEGLLNRARVANLQIALISCRRIGAAIGILMASGKLTQDAAFDLLRVRSEHTNRKLREIADEVILAGTLDRPP
jgi:AmiR/NasT family two-component response regulator